MSTLQVDTQSLIPAKQPYPPGAGSAAEAVLKRGGPASQELASAIRNFDAWLKKLQSTLSNQSPVVDKIAVVDSTGKVIAAIGDFTFGGVPATNYFSEIHVGDPLNTGDPSQALFNANPDGSVTIGQHGWLEVLDPYESDAAWIGTQFDVFDVTGAVAGAASGTVNLIRLTVTGHTLLTGDVVEVRLVVGVTSATDGTSNANGTWTVTKIDANHVDLQASVFVGTYVSGGTIQRLLHVTGAVNNGAGLIRLTVTAHAYESGDKAHVELVGGVPNATGEWIVEVIDVNHLDLIGSTFAGTYTSGGTALRYFAGGLFQTIAIGESFVNYSLRMFADGTLRVRNAEIILTGSGGDIIILDPSDGSITSIGPTGYKATLQAGNLLLTTPSGPAFGLLEAHALTFRNLLGNDVVKLYADPTTGFGRLQTYNHDRTAFLWIDPESGADAISGDSSIGINLDSFKMSAGKIKKYDNADTAGMGVPAIYDSVTLTAQTTSIGATNLQVDGGIAPAGLYRVTFYYHTTTVGGAGIVWLDLLYDNGTGAQVASFTNCSLANLISGQSGTWTLYTSGSSNIQFQTTVSGASGSPQYAVRIVLERLA